MYIVSIWEMGLWNDIFCGCGCEDKYNYISYSIRNGNIKIESFTFRKASLVGGPTDWRW